MAQLPFQTKLHTLLTKVYLILGISAYQVSMEPTTIQLQLLATTQMQLQVPRTITDAFIH